MAANVDELRAALKFYTDKGDIGAVRDLVAAIREATAVPETPLPHPAEEVGALEAGLLGAGRATDRLVKGVKQLYHGARGDEAALSRLAAEAAEDDRAYAPLRAARPWATALGEAVPSMFMPLGAPATLLGAAGRAALAGAAPGAVEYGTAGERGGRALVGAGAGAALPVVGGAVRAGLAAAAPLSVRGREGIIGRMLGSAADDPAVLARLQQASELVPGSRPTAAQVAESGGLAALERAAAAANPEAYAMRAREQAAARVAALRGVAGDEGALQRAKDVRARAAAKSYKHAYEAGVDKEMAEALKPQIASLLERGSVQDAMSQARKMAAEEGIVVDDFGSVQGLHFLKEALDDQISGLTTSPKMQRRVLQTKNDLMKVLEDIAPEYKKASERYARLSRPISQMEIGQELLGRMEAPLADYGGLAGHTAATYARALRNADALAKKATGFRGAKYESIMDPVQRQTMDAIAQDLARVANAQTLGRGVGSDTFQKLAMSDLAQRAGHPLVPNLLGAMPITSRLGRWMYKDADEQMRRALSETLLEPRLTAEAIRRSQQPLLPGRVGGALRAAELRYLPRAALAAPPLLQPIPPADEEYFE